MMRRIATLRDASRDNAASQRTLRRHTPTRRRASHHVKTCRTTKRCFDIAPRRGISTQGATRPPHQAKSGSTASKPAVKPHAMMRRTATRREVACHNASRRRVAPRHATTRHVTIRRAMAHFASRDDASHCDNASGHRALRRHTPMRRRASRHVKTCRTTKRRVNFASRRDISMQGATRPPHQVGFDGQQAGR